MKKQKGGICREKSSGPSWLFCAILSFIASILAFISATVNQNLIFIVGGMLFLVGGIRSVCRYIKEKKQQDEE